MRKMIKILLLTLGATLLLSACGEVETKQNIYVTFKQKGQEDIVKTIEVGDTLVDVPTPVDKIGYKVAWDTSDFTNIYADMVVQAVETANTYTITYDANSGFVENTTQAVVYDSQITLETPTKEDYEFLGWYYGETLVEHGKWTIAQDVTLVAEWEDERPVYTVTFIDGMQVKEVAVKKGEDVASSDVPAFVGKTGYSVAWDNTDLTNIQGNITVNAIYTPNTYTATYKAEGYDIDGGTVELTFGEPCTALDMSLTDGTRNFLGWRYGDITYTDASIWDIAENVELSADWADKDQVLITFIDTDGSVERKYAYIGDDFTDIPSPKVGYSVVWYTDEACTQEASFENITQAMTVYASATPLTYTITYKAEGFDIDGKTINLTYDSYCMILEMGLMKVGYSFLGWRYGDTIYTDISKWDVADNVEIVAEWKEKEQITVTFVHLDGSKTTETIYQGDSLTTLPQLPENNKVGYEYAWDRDDFFSIQEDITVRAIEKPKTYKIKLNTNGHGLTKTVNVTYNEAYTLPTLTHTSYEFRYWMYNGEKISTSGTWLIDEADGVIELIAVWDAYTGEY